MQIGSGCVMDGHAGWHVSQRVALPPLPPREPPKARRHSSSLPACRTTSTQAPGQAQIDLTRRMCSTKYQVVSCPRRRLAVPSPGPSVPSFIPLLLAHYRGREDAFCSNHNSAVTISVPLCVLSRSRQDGLENLPFVPAPLLDASPLPIVSKTITHIHTKKTYETHPAFPQTCRVSTVSPATCQEAC